tara:strand:+ start:379 stop:561 length:183 start_codon:yes stop_codon:yes gene_type:complete
MSQEVALNLKDYQNLVRWYELAFAKNNDTTESDRNTFTKLSAMAMAFTDEVKERLKEEDD